MSDSTFAIIFFPAFVCMWFAVPFLISFTSGWSRLAQAFRAESEPTGERFLWRYGKVGFVYYRNCLNIWSSPAGVYLGVSAMFRLGHPRLFIPCSAMRVVGTRRFFLSKQLLIEVETNRFERVRLLLPFAAMAPCGLNIEGERAGVGLSWRSVG